MSDSPETSSYTEVSMNSRDFEKFMRLHHPKWNVDVRKRITKLGFFIIDSDIKVTLDLRRD